MYDSSIPNLEDQEDISEFRFAKFAATFFQVRCALESNFKQLLCFENSGLVKKSNFSCFAVVTLVFSV